VRRCTVGLRHSLRACERRAEKRGVCFYITLICLREAVESSSLNTRGGKLHWKRKSKFLPSKIGDGESERGDCLRFYARGINETSCLTLRVIHEGDHSNEIKTNNGYSRGCSHRRRAERRARARRTSRERTAIMKIEALSLLVYYLVFHKLYSERARACP
jgi:hypothetical protein